MTDSVSLVTRKKIMSSIRSKDTTPELVVRHLLHRSGFRYRLHSKRLPGKPDIVLPKYQAVILVNGCFWHGHACKNVKIPSTNTSYWEPKILRNIQRDEESLLQLSDLGWRVAIVWECAVKRVSLEEMQNAMSRLMQWLKSGESFIEIVQGMNK